MTSHTPQPTAGDDLVARLVIREARRLEILDWLQEEIGTAWICTNCGYSTYHSNANECADCGEPFPTLNLLAFKLHATGTDDPEYIERAREALSALTQHTEPVAGEVERYIARANELAEDGRYPWWSRLAEILSSYDALAAAKDAKTEKWRAACMEAREGCNQRSDTIRSLRSHLEAAERQRDALREGLSDLADAARSATDARKHTPLINALANADALLSEAEGGK